jgi:hypothetical protein
VTKTCCAPAFAVVYLRDGAGQLRCQADFALLLTRSAGRQLVSDQVHLCDIPVRKKTKDFKFRSSNH